MHAAVNFVLCRRRESNCLHTLGWLDIAEQAHSGKVMLAPVPARTGHPVLLFRPRHEHSPGAHEANIRHFTYQMEQITR